MNGISVGLHGSSAWESAEVDMVVDCVDDLIRPVMTMEYTKNEDEKVRHTGTGPCTISRARRCRQVLSVGTWVHAVH